MLTEVVKTYSLAKEMINADGLIPSGEMLGLLLKSGITPIHRDTFHASYGIGRYALALTWYKTLMGRSVLDNTFCDFDEPISDEDVDTVKKCVEKVVF